MINFLTIISAVICVLLIGIILIQNPKGGGVDSTFGGGANSVFGAARSIDLVEKITWGLAIALFIVCILTAAIVASSGAGEIQLQSAG
jgi:preprotein translocase subunit SecG